MRIISGKFKGRKLKSSNDLTIRPTTDRIKELIFNILHDFPEDKIVLDLFSGSGNLGLEALSRGATKVHFIDNASSSIEILRQNIKTIGIPESQYHISLSDTLQFVKNAATQFDLCLVDPPFVYPRLQELIDGFFQNKQIHSPDTILVVEHEINNPILAESTLYAFLKQKKIGRSLITFIEAKYENKS